MPWRTIEGEKLAPASMPQLHVVIQGLFEKRRLLDFMRYFIVFEDEAAAAGQEDCRVSPVPRGEQSR